MKIFRNFRRLKHISQNDEIWFSNSKTIGFWVDGFNSIRNTTESEFRAVVDKFQRSRILDKTPELSNREFEGFRAFVLSESKISARRGLNALAVVFSYYYCEKRISIVASTQKTVILNNILALVLSKTYRKIYIASYNYGYDLLSALNDEPNTFRPELGYSIAGIDLVKGKIPHIQWYSVNHNNAHAVFFKEFYVQKHIPLAEMLKIAVDIEAFLCHIDVVMYYELKPFKFPLFIKDTLPLEEYDVVENRQKSPRFFPYYSKSQKMVLKSKTDMLSYMRGVLSNKGELPCDLSGWIQIGAIHRYKKWTIEASNRNIAYSGNTLALFKPFSKTGIYEKYINTKAIRYYDSIDKEISNVFNAKQRIANQKNNQSLFYSIKVDEALYHIKQCINNKEVKSIEWIAAAKKCLLFTA